MTRWFRSTEPSPVDLFVFVLALPVAAVCLVAFMVLPDGWFLVALSAFGIVALVFETRSKALYRGATGVERPRHYKPRNWALSATGVRAVGDRLGKATGSYVAALRVAQVAAPALFIGGFAFVALR